MVIIVLSRARICNLLVISKEIRSSRRILYVLLLSGVLIDKRHFLGARFDGVIDHLSRLYT